jgi:hypothetical protein
VALQLIRAGYSQVSVVRGGFQGLVEGGVAIAPKSKSAPAAPIEEAPQPAPAASVSSS